MAMNKPIELLLEQAGIHQPERFNAINGTNQLEQFAKLVAQECAAMAWWTEQYGMGGGVPISKQIEQHFDVPNERAELRKRFGVE